MFRSRDAKSNAAMIVPLSGNRICVDLEGRRITDFDPTSLSLPGEGKWFEPKRDSQRPTVGYLGLRNLDPGDVVWFKDVSVRPLPDSSATSTK